MTNAYDPTAFIGSQTLDGRRAGRIFPIDLRNRRDGKDAGVFGIVSSWIRQKRGHGLFLELLYGCNSYMTPVDVNRHCGGDEIAEWDRYIGLDGQPLDRGYAIEDPRYRDLDHRLGLPDVRTDDRLPAD